MMPLPGRGWFAALDGNVAHIVAVLRVRIDLGGHSASIGRRVHNLAKFTIVATNLSGAGHSTLNNGAAAAGASTVRLVQSLGLCNFAQGTARESLSWSPQGPKRIIDRSSGTALTTAFRLDFHRRVDRLRGTIPGWRGGIKVFPIKLRKAALQVVRSFAPIHVAGTQLIIVQVSCILITSLPSLVWVASGWKHSNEIRDTNLARLKK